jgi:tetratricopeptide (TPR) repeat protein
VDILIGVLGSALWHLILLYPALRDDSEFVRWHARQALLLAGVRTAVPLVLGLAGDVDGVCLAVLTLIPIYLVGNLWGGRQAMRGDCSLMRRFGRAEALPPPEPAVVPDEAKEFDADALVDIIRYSQDPEERRRALSQLEKLGMVESLGDASAATAISTTPVAAPDVASASKKNLLVLLLGGGVILVIVAVALSAVFIRTRPRDASDYWYEATAHYQRGEHEEAIADYTEAIRLHPNASLYYRSRANAYYELGQYEQAIADYTEALRFDPNHLRLYFHRGKAYYELREYEKAMADYTEAIRLDPSDAWAYCTRGNAYSQLGEFEQAIADYTEAIRLEPLYRNGLWAYFLRGNAYYELGEYEEAIADCTEVLRLDPNEAWDYGLRGEAYYELGEYEQAIADYREAVRLDPEYAEAYNNLAWTMAYDLDTNYEEASEYALRAVDLQPVASNHHTLALVYYKLERYDEALEHYSLALSLDSAHASSYRGRGDVYLALGDYQAALDDYQRYLDLEPEASDREAVEETIEWLQRQAE